MEYISRKTWGARYAAGSDVRALPCSQAWLHHTASAAPAANVDAERKAMRALEAIGQKRFGAGFSYNLAIMPSGRVYVGCGVDRIGSHTGGRNTPALGIVLVGNYHDSPVPAPMRSALVAVLKDAKSRGWLTTAALNGGHRDLKPTACPGDKAYALIPAVNKAASAPPPKPPTVHLEEPDVLIIDAPGLPFALLGSGTAKTLTNPEAAAFKAAGVPVRNVTAAQHKLIVDRWNRK